MSALATKSRREPKNRPLGNSHTAKRDPAGTILSPKKVALDYRDVIGNFRFGEPLQSLFKPKFTVTVNEGYHMVTINLTIHAPDADNKQGIIPVMTERQFFADDMEMMDEDYLLRLLRSMVHQILTHEADEAILYKHRRIFDPHRNQDGRR